jgi:hypothetical protein
VLAGVAVYVGGTGVEVAVFAGTRVLVGVEVSTGVEVRVLVATLGGVGVGEEGAEEVGTNTNMLNSGPVAAGLLMPDGWAMLNPFIGRVSTSDPPLYVPLSTGGA